MEIEKAKIALAYIGKGAVPDSDLFASGENWGDLGVGTMDDWEEEIPLTEDNAKKTGWYDWYVSDERYFTGDDSFNWRAYRNELFSQLRSVEILGCEEGN